MSGDVMSDAHFGRLFEAAVDDRRATRIFKWQKISKVQMATFELIHYNLENSRRL